MTRATPICVALAVTLGSSSARAQSAAGTDRGYVRADGEFRVATTSVSGVAHPIDFAEPADINTSYEVKPAPGVDIGGGVRVWRALAVGVDVTFSSTSGSGAVSAQVPHPFFFGRPRSVSGSVSGLTREETAVHAQAVWMLPVSARWLVAVSGGPSLFRVRQDVVQNVTVTQSFPYDTATYAGAVTERPSRTRIGFNVGAECTYRLARHVGADVSARFSRARVSLPSSQEGSVTVTAGGVHVGAGIRFGF